VQASEAAVVSVQVLSAGPADRLPRLELSDLAWDADRRQLLAVSDRGRLHVYALSHAGDGPVLAQPLHRQSLAGPLDLEAMAIDPSGRLHLIDETSGEVLQMERVGAHGWQRIAPGADQPPRPQAAARSRAGPGIEAATWVPGEGLVVARQQPAEGLHRAVSAGGRSWAIRPLGLGATVKAMARLGDDRLVVLEKVRRPGPDGFVLRTWALSCAGPSPCPTQDLPVTDARIEPRDNFEGLTCLDERRCLLVTDDGGSADERTLLVLVRIPPPDAVPQFRPAQR
jgi:Esterase-like activity of phytase